MEEIFRYIITQLNKYGIRNEIHSFDSGCKMIDIWVGDQFYCIQIESELIGLSLVNHETSFDTTPDFIYTNLDQFKIKFETIIKG
jgi:hypothetical protein